MAKNWRLAVCRSRPVLALVSLVISWLLLNVALMALRKYQSFSLEHRIEKLKVGMSREELVQIAGQPWSDEVLADSHTGQPYLRRLNYRPKFVTSGSYRWWMVTLDSKADKIVDISPAILVFVEVDPPPVFKWTAGGAVIGLALAIWLMFLRWCKRVRVTGTYKIMT